MEGGVAVVVKTRGKPAVGATEALITIMHFFPRSGYPNTHLKHPLLRLKIQS